ncbi:protein DGCR6 [Tetranychus urticae]|uniref:Protein DGCR6 n=1 Tax=Tetranychus urticae TaxID=32264 RepID=T1KLP3_TETUR|nr:protein DGCR6 [Tetranychus urticae]
MATISSYSTEIDSSGNDNPDNDLIKRQLQLKHYKLLNELQTMSSELPMEYQQRISHELLSSLASCLLDDTVFQIVNGLQDIQQLTEKNLFQKRMKTSEALKAKKIALHKKHKEYIATGAMTMDQVRDAEDAFDAQIEEEMRKLDMQLIMELDQIVSDQQVTLERAGVPGFHVTNKPNEIKLQMHFLQFILSLKHENNSKNC